MPQARLNAGLCLCLTLALVSTSIAMAAALSEQDEAALTSSLDALSRSWVSDDVGKANAILWKPEYDRGAWQRFFTEHLRAHPFTADLSNYLAYPLLSWGPPAAHVELQEGLAASLTELVSPAMQKHGEALADALNQDAGLRETLSWASHFLGLLSRSQDLDKEARDRIGQCEVGVDEALLTWCLQVLSKSWVEEPVGKGNSILWKPRYDRGHWQRFFAGYFRAHPFTADLSNYLAYPVFSWGSPAARVELQEGLAGALTEIIGGVIQEHAPNVGDALNRDDALLGTLCTASRFMGLVAGSKALGSQTREGLYRFYRDLIGGHGVLQASTHIDIAKHPNLGRLRAQLYMNLVSFALPDVSDPRSLTLTSLSPLVRGEIASALRLQGERLRIWERFSLLLVDNDGLDQEQLSLVSGLMELVPASLHNLGVLTVWEFVGNPEPFPSCVVGCVNIWGVQVGAMKENPFPPDVAPHWFESFCGCLVHELNHLVDWHYVHLDDPVRSRLIEQAGRPALNYLRSMFADGTFVDAPQELLASIANQYFASSERTLELAIARFRDGRKEPLNQFIFFADVYSLGGDSTLFYSCDTEGNIERQTVPLTRDGNGLIDRLQVGPQVYRFPRDPEGNVIDAQVE